MKVRAVLLALGLTVLAVAAQDTFRFTRNFKQGEKDTYKMKATIGTSLGNIDVNMTMSETVKKVYENGDADLEAVISDTKANMNGNEMPVPAQPPLVRRVNKQGMPLGGSSGGSNAMTSNMQMVNNLGLFFDRDFKVGESYPISYTDPQNPKRVTTGTIKVDGINNGEVKLVGSLQTVLEQSQAPVKSDSIIFINASTSKIERLESTITGMTIAPGIDVSSMKMNMERIR